MGKDSFENSEKDIVEFIDENGEAIEFEIVDYFLYGGEEYVILADMEKESNENGEKVDVFIMKVEVIDDENEEFVAVPSEIEEEVLDFAEKFLSGELPNEDEIL